ncbi:MAG: hypothetical protein VYC34_05660, partial [Planctomycetota bacterium]|nr:hypothetical protein [Planctomycetota bacterium]
MARWLSIGLVLALGSAAWAGDLNPPPGPPQATNRVQLNEQTTTLPLTISESGSYVLTSNLTAPPDSDGIIIDADNVTLDLNGFTIFGQGGASGDGVFVTFNTQAVSPRFNVAVVNGVIRGFGRDG